MRVKLVEIGTRLRECRVLLGLSPDDVARELGASPKTIYAWEAGDRELGSLKLARLALLYGVSADYLLFGTHMIPQELRSLFTRLTRPGPPDQPSS